MSNEELMQTRYKVIADYPGSVFEVGKILDDEILIQSMSKYPNLFKKLEWWEERQIKQMPLYLSNSTGLGKVRKVLQYVFSDFSEVIFEGGKRRSTKRYIPATEEEYKTLTPSHNSCKAID